MSWNQSDKDGKDPKNQNPWGGGDQKGPPDLDELLKKLFSSFLKRKNNGGGGGDSGNKGTSVFPRWRGGVPPVALALGALVLLVLWGLSGIYIVSEGKRGVESRFGAYTITTLPGPRWHIPYPIESIEIVDTDSIRSVQNKTRMLTRDENIVEVELSAQYRVKNAPDYLFEVRAPDTVGGRIPESEGTIFQVMESALREIVGGNNMDFILGAGRAEVAAETRILMQKILDDYQSGLEIISVNLQQSQPPSAVQEAFADAIKAREDEIRFVNEAEAYENGIVPLARGEAARMEQDAVAYRAKITASAEGEAERFVKLYQEYSVAPEVTRERLYLQAMEEVLSNNAKVIIDVESGNNIFYLPLESLLNRSNLGAKDMDQDKLQPEPWAGSREGAEDFTSGRQDSRQRSDSRTR